MSFPAATLLEENPIAPSVDEPSSFLTSGFFSPPDDILMVRGEGIYLYDSNGSRYIDCAAATFNLSLGYSNEEVIAAATAQMRSLIHSTSSFLTAPVARLTNKLLEVSPPGLEKVHLKVSSGSAANEGAIKMAQFVTGKTDVISLFRSHLGQTIFTMNASGNGFRRRPFRLANSGILHVPAPYCRRCFYNQKPETCALLCVERINDFIDYASSGEVAAVIVEPVLGNGDNIIPPPGYLQALRTLCDERGITLIFDEVQTGIGRTGQMFAAQTFGVTPDIMTVAKGLGGTGFQVAAILCKPEYAQMDSMHHSFTYGSNVMAAAAATRTLEIISQPAFLANVRTVGSYVVERLKSMQQLYPRVIGDVRGVGLMIGFEIVDDDGMPDLVRLKVLKETAFKRGLIMRDSRYGRGNVLKIRPPLIISTEQAEDLCNILEQSLVEVFGPAI